MNSEEAENRLRDYLLNGIATEIRRADEAYSLAVEIGTYAEEINAASFGELFGSMQITFSDRQTLSVVKIFDPVKKYPTRSIPATLALLESNAELWELPGHQDLRQTLVGAGLDTATAEGLSKAELTRAVVAHFRSSLPSTKLEDTDPLSLSLRSLLHHRDKSIAHNEAIDPKDLQEATWGDATSLVNYAKTFVTMIGPGYLELHFGTDSDDYILASAARRTSLGLRRLLKKAGIVPDTRR